MRWCLVLVVILGVLVAGIAKVATRPRGAFASRPSEEPSTMDGEGANDEPGEAPVSPPAPPRRPRARLPTIENAPARPTIATLHGHVRLPAGRSNGAGAKADDTEIDDDAVHLADLEVVASAGARTLSAHVDREGRFAFHLPPGDYTLRVSSGPWMAERTGVLARGGFDREVDLELARGATIAGRVRGATGELLSVSVRTPGSISGPGEVTGLKVCLKQTEVRRGEDCVWQRTGPYVFKHRPLGATMIVLAHGRTCVSEQRTITVQRGQTRVGVTCARGIGADHDS
ncbi:MAG TPA: carboxypeptidase-like regulatory domain-containing protein [Polyangia bacterium]